MKLYLISFLLIVSAICSVGQSNDKWRAGSAYSLNGKIYVLTVFISETEWCYSEKLKLYDQINEAENWLVSQAKTYAKTIEFSGGNYGLNKTVIVDNIVSGTGSGSEPVNIVTTILRKVGYTSNLQLDNWVKQNTDCTNSLVLIIANKPGTSYSMAYSNEMNKEKYFVEGCILYTKYNNGYDLASSSIAHEFLHLFGAWDLYQTFQQTKEREDKARKIYPNDIMLRTSYNINELKIDKLTAWLVGLNSIKEKGFGWFRPTGL